MNRGDSPKYKDCVFDLKRNSQSSHLTEEVVNMAMPPISGKDVELPRVSWQKNATRRLPGNGSLFTITGNITSGKVKSAVKHPSAYKPNQQINHKKKHKGKKRIAFDEAFSLSWTDSADINRLSYCKWVIHQSVCGTRIWKNTLWSRG